MNGAPLYAGTLVNSSAGTDSTYASAGSAYASALSGLESIYGTSSLNGLGSLYGTSSLNGLGSLYGSSSLNSLGSLYGSSSSGSLSGTSDLAGLGSTYGSSALTGTGSLYGMSSVYGSSANLLSLLLGASMQRGDEEEDSSLDKDSLYNLVELMKLQLMMNVSNQAGTITI